MLNALSKAFRAAQPVQQAAQYGDALQIHGFDVVHRLQNDMQHRLQQSYVVFVRNLDDVRENDANVVFPFDADRNVVAAL